MEKAGDRDVRDAESNRFVILSLSKGRRNAALCYTRLMLRRFSIILSILAGLFMIADGAKALVSGRYFAPGGQIGPWETAVRAIGISPFSPAMKAAFVILGAAYILSAIAYAFYRPGSRVYLAAVAVLTLWYLPVGTVISIIVLISTATERTGVQY